MHNKHKSSAIPVPALILLGHASHFEFLSSKQLLKTEFCRGKMKSQLPGLIHKWLLFSFVIMNDNILSFGLGKR